MAQFILVSFTGPNGVRHSADVTADTLYEAAALGLILNDTCAMCGSVLEGLSPMHS